MAEVLGELGGKAAFVVHGHGGLDELTTNGPNRISYLQDGRVTSFALELASLACARPAGSCAAASQRRTPDPARPAGRPGPFPAAGCGLLLNAAAGPGDRAWRYPPRPGSEARQSLESGAALAKLDELIAFSRQFSQPVAACSNMTILDEIFAHKRQEVAEKRQPPAPGRSRAGRTGGCPGPRFHRRPASRLPH